MGWTFYNSNGEAMVSDGAMSIANNTNNRVVTATGADPASLNGEANLTFDGTNLTVGTGNVIIGTAGKGIDFSNQASPASGMASELLDRYEEGTFTPSIGDTSFDGSGEGQAYTTQVGRYTRIGNRVNFNIDVTISDLGTLTTSASVSLLGLPFTSSAAVSSSCGCIIATAASLALNNASESLAAIVTVNSTRIHLRVWDATAGPTDMPVSELSVGGALSVTGVYEV